MAKDELPPEVERELERYKSATTPRAREPVPLAVLLPAITAAIALCAGLPALLVSPWLGLGILVLIVSIMAIIALLKFLAE